MYVVFRDVNPAVTNLQVPSLTAPLHASSIYYIISSVATVQRRDVLKCANRCPPHPLHTADLKKFFSNVDCTLYLQAVTESAKGNVPEASLMISVVANWENGTSRARAIQYTSTIWAACRQYEWRVRMKFRQ